MNIEIRLMKNEDYDEIYRLWLSCAGMGLNNLDDSREGVSKFLQRNLDTCFVAIKKDNNELVGVIMTGNDGRRGYIYHTSVHSNSRKMGIGKLLVDQALDSLQQNGIHKVALVVFEKNKTGNEFWEKIGFTILNDIIYRNKTINEMIKTET